MSLTFRSVKKISRKKRKNGNKTKAKKSCKDPFDDNPQKFIVEDEENNSDFPTLNSVYNAEIFGTPVIFKNGYGWDCMKFLKIRTKLHSIVFMNEYMNKSFEELRWEDYQCNRKGSQIFQEMNYLKCLSKEPDSNKWKTILPPKKYELIEPVTKNAFGKFPALSKPSCVEMPKEKTEKMVPEKIIQEKPALPKIIEEKVEVPKETFIRSSKERSILTNVDKYQLKETNCFKEIEVEGKEHSIFKTTSEINVKSSKEGMVKDNLQRYFACAYSNASVPYEFFSQNNNYYLPCTNIGLAYKNTTHTKLRSRHQPGYLWDMMKTNPFGYSPIFDKMDPLLQKGSLYEKVFGVHNCRVQRDICTKTAEKYTPENKFSKKYFWSKFSPYPCGRSERSCRLLGYNRCSRVERFTKSKNFWMGIDVVA